MKIYISVDFEGINGVCRFSQVEKTNQREYSIALDQLHKELNAVIKGAKNAGVQQITVNDAHNSMDNLMLASLDDSVSLITGKPKAVSMMAGLDPTYNAVIFLGYHARSSAPGACLAHTFSDTLLSVRINDVEAGESYLNSLYAAILNVPVALVTGDEALQEEIITTIGEIPFVQTKMSLGMNAVKCSANVRLFKELEEQTYASLSNPTNWIINKVNSPYTLEVEVTEIVMADLIELMPFIERISSRKIRFTHPDFTTVYKALQAITVMTGSVGQYY